MTTTAFVTVYHPTHPFTEHEFGDALDQAYSYTAPAGETDPEVIYRRNNAVDGTEENVKAQARSLSVGDVVTVAFDTDLPASVANGNVTIFSVASIGMRDVTEADLETSLAATCGTCPRCLYLAGG